MSHKVGVYILRCDNDRFYIGSTKNIDRRIQEHRQGKVKSTQNILPVELVQFIPCSDLSTARSCEYRLKQYKRKDIIEKVVESGTLPWNYDNE